MNPASGADGSDISHERSDLGDHEVVTIGRLDLRSLKFTHTKQRGAFSFISRNMIQGLDRVRNSFRTPHIVLRHKTVLFRGDIPLFSKTCLPVLFDLVLPYRSDRLPNVLRHRLWKLSGTL
jgi:hypothetical protein